MEHIAWHMQTHRFFSFYLRIDFRSYMNKFWSEEKKTQGPWHIELFWAPNRIIQIFIKPS